MNIQIQIKQQQQIQFRSTISGELLPCLTDSQLGVYHVITIWRRQEKNGEANKELNAKIKEVN